MVSVIRNAAPVGVWWVVKTVSKCLYGRFTCCVVQ
jgi:hypothetical protein